MKILPADKGNTTVILTNEQYSQKMEDHLNTSTYSLLKKDPTDSLTRKLDTILKKLLKEEKIDKKFYDNSRVLHPRAPQIYGYPKSINRVLLFVPSYHFMIPHYLHSTSI